MLHEIDNLIERSLRLNKFTPTFRTIREIPGNARRPISRREQRFGDGPIVRQRPEQVFVFPILYGVNLNFHL